MSPKAKPNPFVAPKPRKLGTHVNCGGEVWFEGTSTWTWRRCRRCGASSGHPGMSGLPNTPEIEEER